MSDGPHLTTEVRRRAVGAVLEGMTRNAVALAYDVDRKTISRWMAKFEEGGCDALLRQPGSGRPRKLEDLTEEGLLRIVLGGAGSCGFETDLWTVGRLRRVIADEFGIQVSKNTIWRRLRDAGLTYQKPEREYDEIDEAARKKWLRYEVPKIRRAVKKYRGILYFQEESNISLTAFLGKTWAPRGQTPKANVTGKRAGVAATSAISRGGHLLFRLLDKRIASKEVIEFLGQMLRHHKHRHLIVVMDRAPPHTSKKTRTWIDNQPRLHVFHLPAYSPDWNPDEKVWNYLKHHELASHQAKNKSEMKELARRKLQSMHGKASLAHARHLLSMLHCRTLQIANGTFFSERAITGDF
jgi:transposase